MAAPRSALNRLFPLVYEDLHVAARRHVTAARHDPALSVTALVHEAYVKLANGSGRGWVDQRHVFAVATRAMQQIAVDGARARRARKRGGGAATLVVDDDRLEMDAGAGDPHRAVEGLDDRLAVAEALNRLRSASARPARVVALRFYAGLSVEETARAMRLSARTVKREWQFARAFLFNTLRPGAAP